MEENIVPNLDTLPKGVKTDLEKKGKFLPPENQDPAALKFYIDRLDKARDERAMNRKEFDSLNFETDYERNRETAFSMLREKINEDDVRVNSGTAEKRIELIHNELMSMNFQPEVRAFDKNNLSLQDASVEFTDIVRATNERESDEDVVSELIFDLLTQRIAIFEEVIEKKPFFGSSYAKKCPKKKRISPLSVYFGDMYIPTSRVQEQPYIVVYDRMLYETAKAIYGHFENWQYVRAGSGMHDEYTQWFKYRFSTLESDEVEIIKYYSAAENEFQIIINSVMMYEPGKKEMPCKTGYPLRAATAKQIPDFVYGKPPIASAKFLQAFSDETFVNLIRKMRQALEPPLGVPNGKVYARDIWAPAAMTQGLTGQNFSRLIDHNGVTASEFQMLNLITQKTEEFIGAASFGGRPTDSMTATQVIAIQQEAIKMLGMTVLAVSRLKREATMLRLESIFTHYLKPSGKKGEDAKDRYEMFELEDGKNRFKESVKKYIILTDENLNKDQIAELEKREEEESEQIGKPVRYSFMNAKLIRQIPMDFHVIVVPEPRESSSFDKILFQDKLAQAANLANLTGKQLDADKWIADFERTWKGKGLFVSTPETGAGAGDPKVQDLLSKIQNLETAETEVPASPMEGSEMAANLTASPKQALANA